MTTQIETDAASLRFVQLMIKEAESLEVHGKDETIDLDVCDKFFRAAASFRRMALKIARSGTEHLRESVIANQIKIYTDENPHFVNFTEGSLF
jgi:hypothetical protein